MKKALSLTLFIILFRAGAIDAQVVSVETELLRDDIPATIQKSGVSLLYPLNDNFFSRSGYRYIFADQDPFHGMPRFRVPMHAIDQSFEASFPNQRFAFTAKGSLTALQTDAIVGDFHLTAAWAYPLSVGQGQRPILLTFRAEGGRLRDISVTTAMHENISYREAAGQLDIGVMEVFDVVGRVTRDWYIDGNRKDAGYAYLLAHLFSEPKLSLGYAWSWANTLRSNWRATGVEFDPVQDQFNFEYFYYPYFSPLEERGHQVLAMLQWWLFEDFMLHGKATIPVSSKGRLKYMPASGNSPVPIDYDATYEVEDILPEHYEAGIIAYVFDPLIISISAEYFSKPYYTYTAGKLALQYRLNE